jgi:hypothetical protein
MSAGQKELKMDMFHPGWDKKISAVKNDIENKIQNSMNGVKDYITAVKNDICHGNEDKCRPGRI